MAMIVRFENPEDFSRVHTINEQAFGQLAEADLVDELRRSCPEALSLVAEDNDCVLGHILFTPVCI